MKNPSSSSKQSSSLFFVLVDLLLVHNFFRWVNNNIQSFSIKFWSFYQPQILSSKVNGHGKQNMDFISLTENKSLGDDHKEGDLCREEFDIVMESLGLFGNTKQNVQLQGESSCKVSCLFEEKEPSLEEVKEAFDVFDQNRDGFIDAVELQRVLCLLGLKEEGLKIENCEKMIKRFDESGDGKIDFHEFVKLMENSFC